MVWGVMMLDMKGWRWLFGTLLGKRKIFFIISWVFKFHQNKKKVIFKLQNMKKRNLFKKIPFTLIITFFIISFNFRYFSFFSHRKKGMRRKKGVSVYQV